MSRRTRRFWPVAVATLGLAGAGLVLTSPTLLLLAVPGVAVLAVGGSDAAPPADALAVERELSEAAPAPGEAVTVTVTLRNTGRLPLPDVRVVDGVPGALTVVGGSPRCATALLPDGEATFAYEVRAERGRHAFAPATVRLRGVAGARERSTTADAGTVLVCEPPLSDVPLRAQTIPFTGNITTDQGGSGLEFHSIREYRQGDPVRLVDWRRYARTGEAAVRQFREERAASVALVVDERPAARWAREPTDRHAVARSASAATQLFAALTAAGDRVGIATLQADRWLAPAGGRAHRAAGRRLLATADAFAYDGAAPPELALHAGHDPVDVDRLLARFSPDTQVVLLSPLCDDGIVAAARRLDAAGHRTTVVAPDPTATGTPGRRLARLQRRNRIARLRSAGVVVVDWGDEPVAAALARARWSL